MGCGASRDWQWMVAQQNMEECMKFKSAAAMALGLAMVVGGLKADDAKAPAWYANTTVHGYGDVNYQYSINGVAPTTGTGGRVFDTTFQSFSVNGAKLAIANTD